MNKLTVALSLFWSLSVHAWMGPNDQARALAGLNQVDAQGRIREVMAPNSFAEHWGVEEMLAVPPSLRSLYPGVPDQVSHLFAPSAQQAASQFFAQNLPTTQFDTVHLLQLFAAPDMLYPFLLFPNLQRAVLVGSFDPGQGLDVEALASTGQLSAKVSAIRDTFLNVFRFSLYGPPQLSAGELLMVPIVARNWRVMHVTYFTLGLDGGYETPTPGHTVGVAIDYLNAANDPSEVVYLQQDLSNEGLKAHPEFLQFLRNNDFETTYYKGADAPRERGSEYSAIHSYVLDHVEHIIQTDDGPAYEFIEQFMHGHPMTWNARFFGVPATMSARLQAAYSDTICRSNDAAAKSFWHQLTAHPCQTSTQTTGFQSMTWQGFLPFRYGADASQGPDRIAWDEKLKLSNMRIFDHN